jgi:hypothetical protein
MQKSTELIVIAVIAAYIFFVCAIGVKAGPLRPAAQIEAGQYAPSDYDLQQIAANA